MSALAVIGGGSFGTAMAIALARRFSDVRLWVHEVELGTRMKITRENDIYLPGFRLPDTIHPTSSLGEAMEGAATLLGAMPSSHARTVYTEMRAHFKPYMRAVSVTKGFEKKTLFRITEVMQQALGDPPVATLSGPTFAREVAAGQPTLAVVASTNRHLASEIQATFSTSSIRLYTSDDPVGVEVGGALKNVVALAAGVVQGLKLGHNALAALITRGLREMTRLAVAMGGQAETLAGLAGMGDLVLTCTGELSRNRRVGIELAEGRSLAEIVASTRMVAEGVHTTYTAIELGRRWNVEMPICEQMYEILERGKQPADAIRQLMERPMKGE